MNDKLDQQVQQPNEVVRLLIEGVQLPVKIARQTLGSIAFLLLINLGSAIWLIFFVRSTFSLHDFLSSLLFVIIALPSLVIFQLYLTLKEVIDLPNKITEFFHASTRQIAKLEQLPDTLQASLQKRDWSAVELVSATRNLRSWISLGKRLRDYFFLARRLRDVQSLLNEFEGLALLTSRAMFLTNPIFLLVVTASIVITIVWALIALITFLVYIF
jgi:hypothetical protein